LGLALTRLGRYAEALLAFEQAAATADGDGARIAEMELRLAEVHDRLGEWDVALDRLQTGLEQLDGDTALAAQLQAHAALLEYRLGRVKDAERRARAASEMAVRVGDRLAGARADNMLGVLAGARGDFTGALGHLDAAVRLAREDADRDLLVAGLNNLARALSRAGRTDDAITAVQEAVDIATAAGDRHHEAALRSHLADLYHATGEREASEEQQRASAAAFAGLDSAESRPELWTLVEW
jgi:tetratricopeptide (TPR) repeat protein